MRTLGFGATVIKSPDYQPSFRYRKDAVAVLENNPKLKAQVEALDPDRMEILVKSKLTGYFPNYNRHDQFFLILRDENGSVEDAAVFVPDTPGVLLTLDNVWQAVINMGRKMLGEDKQGSPSGTR